MRWILVYSKSKLVYRAEAQDICLEECKEARSFADFLIEKGLNCQIVSIGIAVLSNYVRHESVAHVGSTPSCGSSNRFPGVTEIHPGNYVSIRCFPAGFLTFVKVFFDRQQVQAGACKEADVAVLLLTFHSLRAEVWLEGSSLDTRYRALRKFRSHAL